MKARYVVKDHLGYMPPRMFKTKSRAREYIEQVLVEGDRLLALYIIKVFGNFDEEIGE